MSVVRRRAQPQGKTSLGLLVADVMKQHFMEEHAFFYMPTPLPPSTKLMRARPIEDLFGRAGFNLVEGGGGNLKKHVLLHEVLLHYVRHQ